MKIVDISDEIYLELDSPTTLSVPAIAHWLRNNIGALNSLINTTYSVNSSSYEIEDEDSVEIGDNEKVILKKMYFVHYYDLKVRENIINISTDSVISVSDDGSSVTKINKNEISKMLAQLKKQEYQELQDLIHAYKLDKSVPHQVAGDDTETSSKLSTKSEFNRVP